MKLFYNHKIPSLKVQAIWNACAGLLCALEAVVMTIVASNVLGLKATGELTIAFAFGNLFRTIGLWGTRNYHLSDVEYDYDFCDYRNARIVSMMFMIIAIIGNAVFLKIFSTSSLEKIFVVFIIEMVYLVECFEDLVGGEYQRRGRLDIGSKLFIMRWGTFLFSYIIHLYLPENPHK